MNVGYAEVLTGLSYLGTTNFNKTGENILLINRDSLLWHFLTTSIRARRNGRDGSTRYRARVRRLLGFFCGSKL